MSAFEESPRYYGYSSAIGDQASASLLTNLFLFLLRFTGNRRDLWS